MTCEHKHSCVCVCVCMSLCCTQTAKDLLKLCNMLQDLLLKDELRCRSDGQHFALQQGVQIRVTEEDKMLTC